MARPLRAMLFDLDGTLIDSHPLMARCFTEVLTRHLALSVEESSTLAGLFLRQLGQPLEVIFLTVLQTLGHSPESAARLAPMLCANYRRHMPEIDAELRPFPGVAEVLAALRERRVAMAVVTTKHAFLAARHLRSLGLSEFFSAVITGDQCQRCKPDPLPIRLALHGLDTPADHAAAVGDTPGDVAAAKAAGVMSLAAIWGAADPTALLSAGPDRIVNHPCELLAVAEPQNA